jgi:hypothetical protein
MQSGLWYLAIPGTTVTSRPGALLPAGREEAEGDAATAGPLAPGAAVVSAAVAGLGTARGGAEPATAVAASTGAPAGAGDPAAEVPVAGDPAAGDPAGVAVPTAGVAVAGAPACGGAGGTADLAALSPASSGRPPDGLAALADRTTGVSCVFWPRSATGSAGGLPAVWLGR